MHIFDVIVNEYVGKDDRHLIHQLLVNDHLIIQNQKKIMDQLDLLKTAIANEDIQIVALVQAYVDLVTKLNSLPADDSEALAALTADANAQSAAILGALHPVTADPGTGTTDPGTGTTDPGAGTTDPGAGTTAPADGAAQ